MSRSEGVIWCDGCGIEITWVPYQHRGQIESSTNDYCCVDCFSGIACRCGERMEMDDEWRGATEGTASY